ncbi:MAG: OmpA family protein [Paracoccaceae bacterium]
MQTYSDTALSASVRLPVGPFEKGEIKLAELQGTIERAVWTTSGVLLSTLDLIAPLRDQLIASGYSVLFECETRACGGFDFRFKADLIEEPMMHVDLGDFRYLAASSSKEKGGRFVGLLVSRSPETGFIQVTSVGENLPQEDISLSTKQPESAEPTPASGDFSNVLRRNGAAVLEGLQFPNGSAELGGKPSESIDALATFLKSGPEQRIILVGHTDAVGSLQANIALSRKRALSVMKQLVDSYGVDPGQLSAEGIGYLSPRATNETPEGREKNRRVEAVLATRRQ